MSRRAKHWVIGFGLFAAVWIGSVVAGAAVQDPFFTAVAAAAETGKWPARDVRLRQGSYTALPFVFLTKADVIVSTDAGEKSAEIEIVHLPLIRYHLVRHFRLSG
jgi:hypothetical protein